MKSKALRLIWLREQQTVNREENFAETYHIPTSWKGIKKKKNLRPSTSPSTRLRVVSYPVLADWQLNGDLAEDICRGKVKYQLGFLCSQILFAFLDDSHQIVRLYIKIVLAICFNVSIILGDGVQKKKVTPRKGRREGNENWRLLWL